MKEEINGVKGSDLVHQVREEDHYRVDDSHVGVDGALATRGLFVELVTDVTEQI